MEAAEGMEGERHVESKGDRARKVCYNISYFFFYPCLLTPAYVLRRLRVSFLRYAFVHVPCPAFTLLPFLSATCCRHACSRASMCSPTRPRSAWLFIICGPMGALVSGLVSGSPLTHSSNASFW